MVYEKKLEDVLNKVDDVVCIQWRRDAQLLYVSTPAIYSSQGPLPYRCTMALISPSMPDPVRSNCYETGGSMETSAPSYPFLPFGLYDVRFVYIRKGLGVA